MDNPVLATARPLALDNPSILWTILPRARRPILSCQSCCGTVVIVGAIVRNSRTHMAEPDEGEAFWRERFDMTGAEPWTWLFRARGLRRSATALYRRFEEENERLLERAHGGDAQALGKAKEYDLIPSCLLLAALAIENLIKGVLVRVQPDTFRDGQLPTVLNDHDLERLCDRAGIPVTEPDERELLDELTDGFGELWSTAY